MNNRIDQFVTLAQLLERAHAEHLRSVRSTILQLPTAQHPVAIVEVTVTTSRGRFTAQAEASPENVSDPTVALYPVAVCGSRALARALRFALGVGVPAIEEIVGEVPQRAANDNQPPGRPRSAVSTPLAPPARVQPRANEESLGTDAQKRLCFRILMNDRGMTSTAAAAFIRERLGGDLRAVPRSIVSKFIDEIKGASDPRDAASGTRGG